MRRITLISLTLLIFSFGLTINALSQAKEISREEYFQQYRDGLTKRRAADRRNFTKIENYTNGKLFSTTEITDEFLNPNKRHYLEINKYSDKTYKSELIQIDKTYYCRRNDGEWKRSESWCSGGSASGLSNIESSKFTVENVKINDQNLKLYREYTIYKNTFSPDKDKEGLSYWDSKLWLNKEGFIVRQEINSGLLEPERIYRKQTETYEYNPKNLKIEAPIK